MNQNPQTDELRKKSDEEDLNSGPGADRFEEKHLLAFYEFSNSTETRRAYRRVTREFFQYFQWRHPGQITGEQIEAWRVWQQGRGLKAATAVFKISVIRSLYKFLLGQRLVSTNPAAERKSPPTPKQDLRGRCLTSVEAQRLLAGPDRSSPEGARDYALMLILLRTGIRVSEACGLRRSDIGWNQGRWLLTFKTRGGDERNIPLPKEIKEAVDAYLKLDRDRRRNLRSDSLQSFIFQPSVNYRTLEFDKPLSPTQAWKVVRRWGEYTGVGKVSPHDLRSTAITRSLDLGLSPHQVRMMTGHKSLEMITRYARPLEGQEWNAVHFLDYAEDSLASRAGETSGAPAEKK